MAAAQQKYNKLAGKHVLILGGTSGIGFAVAEASIESNARVTISSSSPDRVKKSIESIKNSYPSAQISGYACDLSKSTLEQDLETLFRQTGTVDHIIFTAGDSLARMPIQEITLSRIITAGQIRYFAPYLVAKIGYKYLRSKGAECSFVFTTGGVAEKPIKEWSVVAGYAAGLAGMTRALALDLRPVRVNLVSPGAIDTELWKGMGEEEKEGMFRAMEGSNPTGHVGRAEEVAESYLWLMKDSNTTGTIATSDSGHKLV